MIIIGLLLWIAAFSISWTLISAFSQSLDDSGEQSNPLDFFKTLTTRHYIQVAISTVFIILGTALGFSGIMLKLGKRKIPRSEQTRYATLLYDKVRKQPKKKKRISYKN
jgi:hypothetical protein